MRIRITFSKTEAMRYTGHLDLHRAWERIFRRAGLPIAYSQGFHPQPRINLASALPLGFTSEAEVADIWLEKDLPLPDVEAALRLAAPPGIQIHQLDGVAPSAPVLQTQVQSAEYRIDLLDPVPDLLQRVVVLLAADSLPRERRGKRYDLRPLVESLLVYTPDETGSVHLFTRLAAREGATGRPEEVLDVLGVRLDAVRVHRTRLIFV